MNKKGNPAPKGNQYARKPPGKKKSARRMVNIPLNLNPRIEQHLADIDMTWPEWSLAVIEEALNNET